MYTYIIHIKYINILTISLSLSLSLSLATTLDLQMCSLCFAKFVFDMTLSYVTWLIHIET